MNYQLLTQDKTMLKERQRATAKQIVQIAALLEKSLNIHDHGIVSFKDPDTNDRTIAAEVMCHESSVAKVRAELYGKLRYAKFEKQKLLDESLEVRLAKVENWIRENFGEVL